MGLERHKQKGKIVFYIKINHIIITLKGRGKGVKYLETLNPSLSPLLLSCAAQQGTLPLPLMGFSAVAKAAAEPSSNDQGCLHLQQCEVQPSLAASATTRGYCLAQPWWLALQATAVRQGAGSSNNVQRAWLCHPRQQCWIFFQPTLGQIPARSRNAIQIRPNH